MRKITQEQWEKFVAGNCDQSYSLVVCLCIMEIWEAKAKTKEEAEAELQRAKLGITGAQAEMAISFALANDASEWAKGFENFIK